MTDKLIVDVNEFGSMMRDPKFALNMQQDPQKTLKEVGNPLGSDAWIYRLVVIVLGLISLTALVGGLLLAYQKSDKEIPQMLVALGSTAVGALAGLLAPSPKEG